MFDIFGTVREQVNNEIFLVCTVLADLVIGVIGYYTYPTTYDKQNNIYLCKMLLYLTLNVLKYSFYTIIFIIIN